MSDHEDKPAPAAVEATAVAEAAEPSEPTLTMAQFNKLLDQRLKAEKQSWIAEATKPKAEPEPEKQTLTKTVQALQAKLEAKENAERELSLQSTLKDLLSAGNVPAHMMKAAIATLVHADKLVAYNDDGELVFRGKDFDDDVASGVKSWLRSEDGKAFQAPKGVAGTGDRAYRANGASNNQAKPDAVDMLIGAWQRGEI